MSVDRKEIDLIIRAALKNGKTLEGVTKSIADIEKALDAQTAAAKRGESSIDELKATLLSLQRVQDQLKDQAGLIGQFERLGKQIAVSEEKVRLATKSHADFKDKLDQAGKATDRQRDKLDKLANTAKRNEETLARQRVDQTALTQSLREAGIETDRLAEAGNTARLSAAQLGLAIGRTQAAIATYADDVRKARAEEAARAAESKRVAEEAGRQQAEETKRLADQRAFRQAITTQRLSEIKQAEDEADARRKTAAAAELQAKGYKTLGVAAKSLVSSSGGLREVIQGITQPAEQARTTLAGVEGEIRQIGSAVSSIKGPVENYRQQVQQLVAVQKAVAGQASLVDSYNKQIASLRSARAEFTQARADVLRYAEALRNSGGANDELQASLRRAQGVLAEAQRNLAGQLSTTRSLRDSMKQAGLATNDLTGTQARLTSAAQGSVTALKNLDAAKRRYGEATRAAATAQDLFASSGRTTLSFMQRMRGEVLSLVAAYAGIYGAINGAQKAIDAFNEKQGIQNQLALSAGNDNAKIAEEYEYIRQQADRIGLAFDRAAKGYAKFSASAKLAGRDSQEIRYIFETFAEVGRVANLSADDLDGVFKALEQIISKGSIQAEELRGQLGDRLFGAFQVAAQALKDQFPQLDKAMKNGLVTSDQLLKIAEKYKETVGPRLGEATQNLASNQARLNSALFDFKVLVAEQGFADEYGKLVTTLTEFFQSEDGTQFAKSLSDALSTVVKGLRLVVENAELVKEILLVGLFVAGVKSAMTFGLALATIPAKLAAINTAAAGATVAMRGLLMVFPLISAAAAGWTIGTILREKFVEVRQFGIALVIGLESAWTRIKYGAQILWEEIPAIFADGLSHASNLVTRNLREMLGTFADAARAIGKDELATAIERAAASMVAKTGRIGNASKQLREQMHRDLKAIQDIGFEMWQEAEAPGSTAAKKGGAAPTAKPTSIKPGRATGEDEKAAEKRLKIKEQLENELESIESRIEKNEKDSLTRRLAAIDLQYQKLVRKIRALGGAEAATLEARLVKDIADLKMQETRRFNDGLLKEQADLTRKLEQVDAQSERGSKTDLDKRLNAVKLSHEQTYREIAEFRERLLLDNRDTAPADLMRDRLDAGVAAIQNLERQKYFEDSINAVLEERKAKLDVIAVQEKTGLITAVQARERAAEVVEQTQPKIEAIVQEGLKYVEVMLQAAEATGANTTALETLRAKLLEAQGSAQGLRTEFLSAQQVNEMLAQGATTAFHTMADAIGGAIAGMNSWQDAILATRNAFIQFAADFLMEIGKMIMKQALLNALKAAFGGSSGGLGGAISGAVNAMLKHDGGVVGSGGRTRLADPTWFLNAPRYHGGGIPGLAPDEYPAILKKNEEVLTQSDPRNVLNGGAAPQAASSNLKIINMIDSGSVISEGLSSEPGSKAIFNFIRANRTGLKQILA